MKTIETQVELLVELLNIYLDVDRGKHFDISYELEKKIIDIIKAL